MSTAIFQITTFPNQKPETTRSPTQADPDPIPIPWLPSCHGSNPVMDTIRIFPILMSQPENFHGENADLS